MDAENDNDQPNSSSASASSSSSNNSSSSNLLGHLPMLPFMRSTDDDEQEADGEEDGNDNDLNEEPMPLQPSATVAMATVAAAQPPSASMQPMPTSSQINNSTASTSANAAATSVAAAIASSSVGREEEPMEAANSVEVEQQQQQQNDIHLDDNDNNAFDVDLNLRNAGTLATNATTSNHQQIQQQEIPQSISLDISASGSAGPSSSEHQNQTIQPPTTLPLLLQQQQQEEEPLTEESKHLPSYDHHYHNPSEFQLDSHPYQNSSAFPYGYRVSELIHKQHSNGALNTSNNNIFGSNTMSSDRHNTSTAGIGGVASGSNSPVVDRIKMLYPNVNENETPLPRCWSPQDKCLAIGLSQNNLRVHFKGIGKQTNDAASVRTAHPIPISCGIYYFEVKIISKGRNGYMGIGLTAQQFRMNRLPGWDKQSYGYHGDDGNSFSSSGHGQSYGPTFTTGDIIGCCVNFINNTCFYTKNGVDLGIAFRDLPSKLYPTVGLQTPGEEVDANFGQEPFKFEKIEEMMKEMRREVVDTIHDFPLPAEQGDSTALLQKIVNSYLVHNGYSQTAEAFARQKTCQHQNQKEEISSIRNRQKILKLVMSGKVGQAIDHTMRLYPGLLENNKNLWFMLKCRQFIEMINGSDVENGNVSNNSSNGSNTTDAATSTTETSGETTNDTTNSNSNTINTPIIAQNSNQIAVINTDNDLIKTQNSPSNNDDPPLTISKSNNDNDYLNDVEMENGGHTNGNVCKNGNTHNFNDSMDGDEEMDVDITPSTRKYSHGIERILDFGKDLSQMGQQLEKENKMTDEERQMLEDAFSLIAYSNPWSSPLGWQLCPTKRETICRALNSAILNSMSYPKWSPLEYCIAHAHELLQVMAQSAIGVCGFVNVHDAFPKN